MLVTVRDVARLHPATVTALSEGTWRPVRRRSAKTAQSSPVRVVKVDRRVWKTAVRLAGGDYSRLVVESPTSVLVLNKEA